MVYLPPYLSAWVLLTPTDAYLGKPIIMCFAFIPKETRRILSVDQK